MRLVAIEELDKLGYWEVWREEENLHLLILKRDQGVIAYHNECPHQGRPLNFATNRFLFTPEGLLICPHHGASFQPDDGLCVSGPCLGSTLIPFPVRVEEGWVVASAQQDTQEIPSVS